jgi:hypothetical protein
MDKLAEIDEITHEITMIFVSVNAKNNPAIKPVSDTIASCIPKIIALLYSDIA